VRIWEHTFAALTGGANPQYASYEGLEPQPFIPQSVVPITHNPKFATAMLTGGGSFAHQVLLELQEGNWVCVGSYVDDTINIDRSLRGKGLAEELVLRCVEHRHQLPLTTGFSHAGHKLLKRTHRLAIDRALKADLHVPQDVLDEYRKG
jgi:hypothetical protein